MGVEREVWLPGTLAKIFTTDLQDGADFTDEEGRADIGGVLRCILSPALSVLGWTALASIL